MARAQKKPGTAGEQSPAVSHDAAPSKAKCYRINRPFAYADVAYAVGDTSPLITEDTAARIRLYAGADALTHVVE